MVWQRQKEVIEQCERGAGLHLRSIFLPLQTSCVQLMTLMLPLSPFHSIHGSRPLPPLLAALMQF